MRKTLNLTGIKVGRLTVIKRTERPSNVKNKKSYWLCKCDCGNEKVIIGTDLKSGGTQSCGCLMIERIKEANTTHGMTNTRFYTIWRNMLSRCENSLDDSFEYYGQRGIKVSNEWHIFENFMKDMYKSYISFENINGEKSPTIDRVNVNGDYEVSNCRWATILEQNRNKRNSLH